jgi:hypothetical protein
MNGLEEFINNMVSSVGNGDFRFVLLRESKENPCWYVFACEFGSNKWIVSGIDGAIGIGGHYEIEKGANLQEVLSVLADSGWKVELHSYFYFSMTS